MCDQEVVRGHLRGHEVRLVRDLDAIVGEAIRLNLADEVDGFDAMPADERVAALEELAVARKPLGSQARLPESSVMAYAREAGLEAILDAFSSMDDGHLPLLESVGNSMLAASISRYLSERRRPGPPGLVNSVYEFVSLTDVSGDAHDPDYVGALARLASGLVDYSDRTWRTSHATLADAMAEDLLDYGERSPRTRLTVRRATVVRAIYRPVWHDELVRIGHEAVEATGWVGGRPDDLLAGILCNPEYAAARTSEVLTRAFPTVGGLDALRWLLVGGTLEVPDVTVRASPGQDSSFVVTTSRGFSDPPTKYYGNALVSEMLGHRRDARPYAIPLDVTEYMERVVESAQGYVDDRRPSTTADHIAHVFANLVAQDLSAILGVPYPGVPRTPPAKPLPHESWLRCVEMCLGIAVRELLGVDVDGMLLDEIEKGAMSGRTCRLDYGRRRDSWDVVCAYFDNEGKKAEKFRRSIEDGDRTPPLADSIAASSWPSPSAAYRLSLYPLAQAPVSSFASMSALSSGDSDILSHTSKMRSGSYSSVLRIPMNSSKPSSGSKSAGGVR